MAKLFIYFGEGHFEILFKCQTFIEYKTKVFSKKGLRYIVIIKY